MFAKNGFQNVAEKIRLGRFVLERFTNAQMDKYSTAERMRMSFEELGPTFVKLGQVLATRPDLVPADFVEEFKKLHDQVSSLPFEEIEKVLRGQFGSDLSSVFSHIDRLPLAAASIAQVHKAQLADGTEVVVKVQRPGIKEIIENDISVLYFIADLLNRYLPESRVYNPVGIVDEFFQTIEQETNFIIEANSIRRFSENFKNDPQIKIPQVYFDYSGERVLVMEALPGRPLSQKAALEQEGVDPEEVMRVGIHAYFKMVFQDGFFHGDLHAGNLFILPGNQIGLIDFGIVGRLNRRTRDAIANMFVALYTEDYERLAYEYVELTPYSPKVDVDRFAKDLQGLLAPYFGLSMRNVDLGKLLMDSTAIAADHGLVLPSELMLFFKSIVTVESMGRVVVKDFDLLAHALEFSSELLKARYEPKRIREDLMFLARDSAGLLHSLPRQIKQITRKLNNPDFSVRVSLREVDDLRESLDNSARLVFYGLIIGALLMGSFIGLSVPSEQRLFHLPLMSALGFLAAGILTLLALRKG